jgi:hypothetical protein
VPYGIFEDRYWRSEVAGGPSQTQVLQAGMILRTRRSGLFTILA